MTDRRSRGDRLLREGIVAALRIGTVVAVVLVGAGWAWSLAADGAALDGRGMLELVAGGGAGTLIGAGLVGLTFLPMAVLAIAIAGFRRTGEHRMAAIASVVLALLVVSLLTTAIIGAVGA